MAAWNNENEMFELMKEKLYTPVVGDILDQMGYKHQFLPAPVRPLAAQVPTEPYKLRGEQQDNRLKVAGYACTVLENDVFEYPEEKPFGYMTEALDDLKPNEVYVATGSAQQRALGRAADGVRESTRCSWRGAEWIYPRYAKGYRAEFPGVLHGHMGAGFFCAHVCIQMEMSD